MAADRTHPFDIVLALRLLTPAGTMATIADELAVAPSQVHAALGRLGTAGLLRKAPGSESRTTNARALAEFLLFGVRYVFPAVRGPLAEGVPTAWSAPALASQLDAPDALVWPTAPGPATVRGFSIRPLYRNAVLIVRSAPATYRLLTLVDAMRLGEPRARNAARAILESELGWSREPA